MMKALSYFIIIILILTVSTPVLVSSNPSEIYIQIEGNPIDNFFTGTIKISYSETSENYVEVSITLPFEGDYNILNITSDNGVLITDYQLINNTLSFLAYNASKVTISFTVENVFEEAGVGSYTTFLDLTRYSGLSVNVNITLVGTYYVEGPFNVKHSNGYTIVTLDKPGFYPLSISINPETQTSPSDNQGKLILLVSIVGGVIILLILLFLFRKRK